MENYPVIRDEFATNNRCLTSHPRPMNKPIIILGAGPSLDKAAPLLKDWRNPIICSTSNAFVSVKWERTPEYICAFDSLWTLHDHLKLKNTLWKDTTLFTHPNAEPKLIKAWKWKKYYYRRVFPGQEFFEFIFPLMFPWIKVGFVFSGSVINNAIHIAIFLGFNPIILVGCDYGWKDHSLIRATNWEQGKDDKWSEIKLSATQEIIKESVQVINGTYTSRQFLNFKDVLLKIYAGNKSSSIIDCSDGIIDEFPKVSIEEIIKTQGWGNYNFDEVAVMKKIKSYFVNGRNIRK
jgi:hypothetical protein